MLKLAMMIIWRIRCIGAIGSIMFRELCCFCC